MPLLHACKTALAGAAGLTALGAGARGIQVAARRRTAQALEEEYQATTEKCKSIEEVFGYGSRATKSEGEL
jgi:hypothetical protein